MPVRPNRDALPMSRLARLAGCGWLALMLGFGAGPVSAQTNMQGAGQGTDSHFIILTHIQQKGWGGLV